MKLLLCQQTKKYPVLTHQGNLTRCGFLSGKLEKEFSVFRWRARLVQCCWQQTVSPLSTYLNSFPLNELNTFCFFIYSVIQRFFCRAHFILENFKKLDDLRSMRQREKTSNSYGQIIVLMFCTHVYVSVYFGEWLSVEVHEVQNVNILQQQLSLLPHTKNFLCIVSHNILVLILSIRKEKNWFCKIAIEKYISNTA